MNRGLFAVDCVLSPPDRKQCSNRCKANSAHIDQDGWFKYIKPGAKETKNGQTLSAEAFGLDMCSKKHAMVKDAHIDSYGHDWKAFPGSYR